MLLGYLYGFSKEVIDKYLTPNSYKDAFVFIPGLYQPRSKGEVRLVSRDPRDQLLLDYRTFSDKKDLKSIVEGCKLIDRIMNTKAVQIKLNAEPFENTLPGCTEYDYGTDDYFACVAQTLTGDGWHQCCTARMGTPSDPMAVVDPELKVIGVNKLRVVDLSIMPEIPNSNTNAPANMIGEKAADIIMSKYSK